jgi:membrane protein YdbS with pleckstrin-like domain
MSKHPISIDEELAMFDKPHNVKRVLYALYACVVLLLAVDLFYHKHGIFTWESSFGFYSVYGFVACVILVIVAKYVLRPLVMRKEDYYND